MDVRLDVVGQKKKIETKMDAVSFRGTQMEQI